MELAKPFAAIYLGATQPYPQDLTALSQVRVKPLLYNPPDPEGCLSLLAEVIHEARPQTADLKRELGIRKAEVLTIFSAFVDQHSLPMSPVWSRFSGQSARLRDEVLQNGAVKPVDIGGQLSFALRGQDNNLQKAVLLLALTTRQMARNYDNRITPPETVERMKFWKTCVAGFGWDQDEDLREDTAGDNYHFWLGVLAGMSVSGAGSSLYERMTKRLCSGLYGASVLATDILRYRMMGHEGRVHQTDIAGFQIGKSITHLCIPYEDGLVFDDGLEW